ncbi:MAG: cupredoxin domain-containing protein [Methanosarcinales archaeon]
MEKKKAFLYLALLGCIIGGLVLVYSLALLSSAQTQPQEREITIYAERFFYTPSVIEVNKGDKVTIRLISKDVHHGLYIDGYELETSARPGYDGKISFIANKTGRFTFRCSVTCGPFHPYMTGYLRVKPDTRTSISIWASIAILGISMLGVYLFGRGKA